MIVLEVKGAILADGADNSMSGDFLPVCDPASAEYAKTA
jgi:hypothetical protein